MKHTPGPWRLSHHNAPIGDTGDYDLVTTIDGTDNHRVADWFNPSDIDEANAKLIAAAPELLESLKELLESYYAMMPPYETGKSSQDAWADRRAAARANASALIARLS